MIHGVLLDLAGVVYAGDAALPGALDAVRSLRGAGLQVRFVTNTTRSSKRTVLRRLTRLGLAVGETELFTPARAARDWLERNDFTAHLLVHPDLACEFAGDAERVGTAVVIGDAGEAFTYDSLNRAFRAITDGAALIALARNRTFRDSDGRLSLDAGAFVAALEHASGREALTLGKPAPAFFAAAVASMNCSGNEVVMVGDDAEADVAGALRAGIGAALLVRTGKYRDGDEARFEPVPTATVDDLASATDWILSQAG